jgi:ABC-type glycerol-3-phosphate transport system permease component
MGTHDKHLLGANSTQCGQWLWHFLLRQYFHKIPIEFQEAAAIRLQVLWQIMLPLARPALVTLFSFTFIGEWNH